MTTIANQEARIRRIVQDTDSTAYSSTKVLTQHQDEITRLCRERRMGTIVQMQAVRGTALYTLNDYNVQVMAVYYNETRLDYASEEMLDRKYENWEYPDPREPKYWTTDNQNPNVVRIIPPPSRSGSITPEIPPVGPFPYPMRDNLLFFVYRDFRQDANDGTDTLPLLTMWEDPLVWRTASELARREGEYQNLPLSRTASALAEMWLGLIES